MFKHRLLALAGALLISMSPVYAQKKGSAPKAAPKGSAAKVKVTWGESYEVPKHYGDAGFFGNPKDGYAEVFLHGMTSLFIKKFDGSMTPLGDQTIDISDMRAGANSEAFYSLKGNTWWIYSSWDRDEHMERLHARKLDLQNMSVGSEVTLLESPRKMSSGSGSYGWGIHISGGAGKYTFNTSSDESKLMVQYMLKPEVKRDSKSFEIDGMFAFDENMKKVNGDEFTMPHTEAMMDNDDYEVDKTGNMYLLAKVYEEERKESKDKKTPNYHFEIYRYAPGSKKPEVIPFALDNGFAKSIMLVDDAQGNIYSAGFYSKTLNGPTNGAFMLRLEAGKNTFSKFQKGYYDFPVEVLKSFETARTQAKMDKKEAKGKNVGSANLELRNFAIQEDGSVTIVGEEYWVEVHTTYNASTHTSQTTYTYHYNDIYALNVDPTGNMAWVRKIPKTQTGSSGLGGMSYKFFAKGKDTYLFYLDNAKNATLTPDKAPAHHMDGKGGILVCVKIDAKGGYSRTVIFDSKEVKKRIFPTQLRNLNSNTLAATIKEKKRKKSVYTLTIE